MAGKIIHIQIEQGASTHKTNQSNVHLLPCKIHADCDAKVDKYFNNNIEENAQGYLTTSFRGYPLKGDSVAMPAGYRGIVFQESKCVQNDSRTLFPINNFDRFTYWNWGKIPNKNDAIKQALDWIDIAEVLHSPIREE